MQKVDGSRINRWALDLGRTVEMPRTWVEFVSEPIRFTSRGKPEESAGRFGLTMILLGALGTTALGLFSGVALEFIREGMSAPGDIKELRAEIAALNHSIEQIGDRLTDFTGQLQADRNSRISREEVYARDVAISESVKSLEHRVEALERRK